MNMSERIAFALAESGRSPRELARDIGVSVARISQLKSGTSGIKAENLFALARATGCSPQWIAEGVGKTNVTEQASPAHILINSFHKNCDTQLAFDLHWLQKLGLSERALRYAYFSDGTMEPSMIQGDLFLIDIEQNSPENGNIYVILRSDGEAVVKRLLQTMTTGWIIRSDNENKRHYPDEVIGDGEIGTLRVVGRVVWRGGAI